jgi:hypothetical protein
MDKIDLRENTNIEATTKEYSVEALRQKFAEQESLVALQQRELEARQHAEKNYIDYLREKEEGLQNFAGTKEERLALEGSINKDKEDIALFLKDFLKYNIHQYLCYRLTLEV